MFIYLILYEIQSSQSCENEEFIIKFNNKI